jgi:hypothetical protein
MLTTGAGSSCGRRWFAGPPEPLDVPLEGYKKAVDLDDFRPNPAGKVVVDGLDYTGYIPAAEFKATQLKELHEKYGEGPTDLYRTLYKELCDEIRRERHTKPPAPNSHIVDWQVEHKPGTAFVTFRRKAGNADVLIGADLNLRDPKQINEVLTFLNWYPMDVMIKRDAYVLHFQVACAEQQLFPRNIRAYHDPKNEVFKFDAETDWRRKFMRYDGPYMKHMEMDVQTELFDLMIDIGLTSYATRHLGEWIVYFEHVEYIRWLTKTLDAVLPEAAAEISDERQILTLEERRALDEEVEEWRDEAMV